MSLLPSQPIWSSGFDGDCCREQRDCADKRPAEPRPVGPPQKTSLTQDDADQEECRDQKNDGDEIHRFESLAALGRRERHSEDHGGGGKCHAKLNQRKAMPVVGRQQLDRNYPRKGRAELRKTYADNQRERA